MFIQTYHALLGLAMLLHKTLHPHESLFNAVVGGAVGGAHIAFASFTKSVARDDGDFFLEEELFGEFVGAEAGDGDVGEGVEGSTGLAGGQADAVEASD